VTVGNDISWRGSGETFNLRVAAVITRGEKILLCTVDGVGHWLLPGGRVRFGESSQAALARELAEELGHRFPDGRLSLVVENIYRDGGLQHEVGLYYHLAWPDGLADDDTGDGVEPGHAFRWVSRGELDAIHFEPADLAPTLHHLGDGLRHLVLDRRDQKARYARPAGQPQVIDLNHLISYSLIPKLWRRSVGPREVARGGEGHD
jgi:ADP-ribose pyrophosphatase YjhB (NUDIX family)